jgi:Stage II sporulation protein E (SpoIIE)
MERTLSPLECVVALQRGDESARAQIEDWIRQPVGDLIDRAIVRHRLKYDSRILNERVLLWVLMYLRSRDASTFAGMVVDTFLAQILFAASRLLTPTTGTIRVRRSRAASFLKSVWGHLYPQFLRSPNNLVTQHAAPHGTAKYSIQTYLHPYENVGGDWIGFDIREGNSNLWLFVADVTGHGYPAHILARGLPYLWQSRRMVEARARGELPTDLLDLLGRELDAVLPGDLFIEATLGCIAPTGEATLAVAGACPVIIRQRDNDEPTFHILSGTFLGLEIGVPRDQMKSVLNTGDELLIASDGLFEQRDDGDRQLKAKLAEHLRPRLANGEALHEAVLEILADVLGNNPQGDDISVVTVRVRD